jgi:hypothetical protein
MVRCVDEDFEQLRTFLDAYSLSDLAAGNDQRPLLKKAHKLYLSILHLWAQCQHQLENQNLCLDGVEVTSRSDLLPFFREAVSDIGNGFFCCLHGAYKPAHMALRSSIENFLRFISGGFNNNALTTTSVYELFDIAKQTAPFQGRRIQRYTSLHECYRELCKFTHSASLDHMSGVHALSHFPSFDKDKFDSWAKHEESVCIAIASTLCISDRSIYLKAHYKTQEVLDLLLPTLVRREILNDAGLKA